jgi:phage tail tape-measure protein
MSTNATLKRDLAKVASALKENISDEEMDQLLAGRRQEIEILLEEAREAKRRGAVTALEPLHGFLRRARERLHSG